ncbi:hypothetical protein, partial [Streptomyces sp. NPDC052107]|uniref:hypothetical protein n=1 Tax=Streptomyces sp. NPDC052107 TaxID=3155632 RepID=UPI0034489440
SDTPRHWAMRHFRSSNRVFGDYATTAAAELRIHRRYHGCIDGHEEVANARIAAAMEEDGDTT